MPVTTRELAGAEYPPRLRDLVDPPEAVYVVGELPRGPSVGIVGTRDPTPEAERFATELSRGLTEEGVTVFSGGALGIDTAAHRGALDAGGPTVVVAPSSFDRPFPSEHESLFREIVDAGGAFLTTYPPGTIAHLHHFFERNALLVALVDALVVVETRFRGGARNAAKAARDLGRPLLVVPGAPWNPRAAGCLLEIKNGATLVSSIDDVLIMLGVYPNAESRGAGQKRPTGLVLPEVAGTASDPDLAAVVGVLENGAANPDEICAATGLGVARVQALLLTLTLERILVSEPSGRVSLLNVGID